MAQPTFWILAALAGGRRHGYDIMREIADISRGRVALKVSTLYAALSRLDGEGLIRIDGEEVVGGRARRYYQITNSGCAWIAEEADLMEQSARLARSRLAAGTVASLPCSSTDLSISPT